MSADIVPLVTFDILATKDQFKTWNIDSNFYNYKELNLDFFLIGNLNWICFESCYKPFLVLKIQGLIW